MKCYVHNEADAIGACVGCGQFICNECNTPINGRNHCKPCIERTMSEQQKHLEKLEADGKQPPSPMVFMNSGGGGGGSSSSASSAATAAVTAQATPSQSLMTKSRVTAAILAFFLGGLGIHKFYCGQTGWGILYLLFCWTFVPAIVALIEGIIYLTMTDEAFNAKYGGMVRY